MNIQSTLFMIRFMIQPVLLLNILVETCFFPQDCLMNRKLKRTAFI